MSVNRFFNRVGNSIQKIIDRLPWRRNGNKGNNTDEDEAFFRELNWLRSDPKAPNAKVTKRLYEVNITGSNRMTMKADDLGSWPVGVHQDTHGVIALAVMRNGRWEGGKFDHVRRNTTIRDFNNVGEYLPVTPISGEPVRFWLINYAGTEASNVVEKIWP